MIVAAFLNVKPISLLVILCTSIPFPTKQWSQMLNKKWIGTKFFSMHVNNNNNNNKTVSKSQWIQKKKQI